MLHEQYQSRLDAAVSSIRSLQAQSTQIATDLGRADQASVAARSMAQAAREAYAQGNLDARSLLDYETAAAQREQELFDLQRSWGELQIAMTVELGVGLPSVLIAHPATMSTP
jgi:outer membrane protein TolC